MKATGSQIGFNGYAGCVFCNGSVLGWLMDERWDKAITSVHNPRVKQAIGLRNARERRRSGQCLIDGEREISLALAAGLSVTTIFVSEGWSVPDEWLRLGVVQRVGPRVMDKLSYGERHDLPVAVAQTPSHAADSLQLPPSCLLLVLDRIEKPGNLGACLRTAIACGVDAVILNSPICELYNPNTIRSSRGALFQTRIAITHTAELLDLAGQHSIRLLTARVDGEQGLWDCDFRGNTAVVFGNEAEGLGDDWRVDRVRSFQIPMRDAGVDSLNVSISAAVTLYEAMRQRQARPVELQSQ